MTTWPFEDSFVVAYGAICSVASALTSKISIDRTGHQIRGVETAQLRPNPSDFLALLTSPKPFGRWGNLGATWAQNPLFYTPIRSSRSVRPTDSTGLSKLAIGSIPIARSSHLV